MARPGLKPKTCGADLGVTAGLTWEAPPDLAKTGEAHRPLRALRWFSREPAPTARPAQHMQKEK